MEKPRFDEYIRRFNGQDPTAFEEFLHPHCEVLNGTLEIHGSEGMKEHYAIIWKDFSEALTVDAFVSDDHFAAIRMWAHFTALHDAPDSLFGPVKQGHCFDFRGVIMYWLDGGKFTRIQVAYNSFLSTEPNGTPLEIGLPH